MVCRITDELPKSLQFARLEENARDNRNALQPKRNEDSRTREEKSKTGKTAIRGSILLGGSWAGGYRVVLLFLFYSFVFTVSQFVFLTGLARLGCQF